MDASSFAELLVVLLDYSGLTWFLVVASSFAELPLVQLDYQQSSLFLKYQPN